MEKNVQSKFLAKKIAIVIAMGQIPLKNLYNLIA